jgi:3-oxoacyl-[acyl-carrier protein] reductase
MGSLGNPIPTSSLEGKSALVTGGGRGIGRAISLQLARKGISFLAITYVGNKTAADDVASQCRSLGAKKVAVIKADLLDPEIGPKLLSSVFSTLNITTLDIVVNNAALVDMALNQPFTSTTLSGFTTMLQGNCFAPISIINAALHYLPAHSGRVINISSVGSKNAPDPLMSYGASKAALDSYTRSLAMTFAKEKKATFNSVSVGATRTEAMEKAISSNALPEGFLEGLVDRVSADTRFGEPEDVAMIVGWLASEESRWINGASVMAHGGDAYMLAAQG